MNYKNSYAWICLLSLTALGLGGYAGQPTYAADGAPYDLEEEAELRETDDTVALGLTLQALSAESKDVLAQAQAQTTSCAGRPNFTPCGTPTTVYTECKFGTTCGLEGERDALEYIYLCRAEVCQVFPAFTRTEPCSRPRETTDGVQCNSNSCNEYCQAYVDYCVETTPRYRRCGPLVCSNGSCNTQVNGTTTYVGTCERETEGSDCPTTCNGRPQTGTCSIGRCWCEVP